MIFWAPVGFEAMGSYCMSHWHKQSSKFVMHMGSQLSSCAYSEVQTVDDAYFEERGDTYKATRPPHCLGKTNNTGVSDV
jgi:hypothetical protein